MSTKVNQFIVLLKGYGWGAGWEKKIENAIKNE